MSQEKKERFHEDAARRSGRLGDTHSIADRYDHDVDELMA